MTTPEEGFARRWSRLKRQSEAPIAEPQAPPAVLPAEALPEPVEEEPPPAEAIPLTDIAYWLKRRVPDVWRQAALRRLWVSDPLISGYIGPADYAWDWNTPGGAPGWGAMRAIDDIAQLLSRAIGEPLPPPPPDQIEAEPPAEARVIVADDSPEPEKVEQEAIAPETETPTPILRRGGRATPV